MKITPMPIMHLDLRQPVNYFKIESLPSLISENDEFLLCYELNPAQSVSIEPERGLFLNKLLYTGKKTEDASLFQNAVSIEVLDKPQMTTKLPAGQYVFVQYRNDNPLTQDEWLDMAIEQQKDGLWERNKLGNTLYIRFLFEDGKFVTQLFRVKV